MCDSKSIILIGDSPAIYVCAIYLYTANLFPLIVRTAQNLNYKCTAVPGVDATKEEYNEKCYLQAKNMGIQIEDASKVQVKSDNGKYEVYYNEKSRICKFLVSDVSMNVGSSDCVFVVDDLIYEREAIVVAGTGCMIAFEIKDIINNDSSKNAAVSETL